MYYTQELNSRKGKQQILKRNGGAYIRKRYRL